MGELGDKDPSLDRGRGCGPWEDMEKRRNAKKDGQWEAWVEEGVDGDGDESERSKGQCFASHSVDNG